MPLSQTKNSLNRQSSLADLIIPNKRDDAHGRSWWTVYTRAGQETSLTLQLSDCRIPSYLPLAPRQHIVQGRRAVSQLPLFNNFLFLFGNDEDCLTALSTRMVSRILPVTDGQRLRCDLMRLHQLIKADLSLTVEPRIPRGTRIRVSSGPLSGLEGTLIERAGQHRLLVAVEEIGQGVSIPIDHLTLDPA